MKKWEYKTLYVGQHLGGETHTGEEFEKVLNEFRNVFDQYNIAYEEVKVIPFSDELPVFTPVTHPIFYGLQK